MGLFRVSFDPFSGGSKHKNCDCILTWCAIVSPFWDHDQVCIGDVEASLPRHRAHVSRLGRCRRMFAYFFLPLMVRLFPLLKTLLTHYLHCLQLFRPPKIVRTLPGTDLRIFLSVIGKFTFPSPQLYSICAGVLVLHWNTLFLRIPRFFTHLK